MLFWSPLRKDIEIVVTQTFGKIQGKKKQRSALFEGVTKTPTRTWGPEESHRQLQAWETERLYHAVGVRARSKQKRKGRCLQQRLHKPS